MLISLIFSPFVLLAEGIIGLLPTFEISSDITGFFSMFSTAINFFPSDVWIASLACIFFWLELFFLKSVINFVFGILPLSMRVG